MILTSEMLKQESCNFDLECVFTLDLSDKRITDLGDLKECINLEILNLSFNDIKDLTPLSHLTKLQFLNLSNNLISSLDGLEDLESLQLLNLAGNYLSSVLEFKKLSECKSLNQLKLINKQANATNPLCSISTDYKQSIHKVLPFVEIIDGANLKYINTEMKMADEFNKIGKNSSKGLNGF